MQITKNAIETTAGRSEWFTGRVYVDSIATPAGPSRLSASSVDFTPGARTAWHTHPNGQTIYVTRASASRSAAAAPSRSSAPVTASSSSPDHWHGAAPNRFMTHLAMLEVDNEGNSATWGDHVSDEEYGAAPPIDLERSPEP